MVTNTCRFLSGVDLSLSWGTRKAAWNRPPGSLLGQRMDGRDYLEDPGWEKMSAWLFCFWKSLMVVTCGQGAAEKQQHTV